MKSSDVVWHLAMSLKNYESYYRSGRLQVCNKFWTILNKFIYIVPFSLSIPIYLGLSWSIFVHLDLSWSNSLYLHLSSSTLGHLDLSWSILVYLGPSLTISVYLGLSQTISSYMNYLYYLWLSLAIIGHLWLSQDTSIKYQGASEAGKSKILLFETFPFFFTTDTSYSGACAPNSRHNYSYLVITGHKWE